MPGLFLFGVHPALSSVPFYPGTMQSDIELSNAKRKSLNMGTTQEDIKQIRETWADLANHALERAGYRE